MAKIRPSLWHLLWSAPFFLVGGGVFFYSLVHGMLHLTDALTQIVVPGKTELNLQSGQVYTVFVEQQSVVSGKIYSTNGSIDGLACRVVSTKNGASVPISKTRSHTTYDLGARSGRSVLEFSVEESGPYEFACDYGEDTKGPEVVMAVGAGVSAAIFRMVGLGLASFFGGGGAGAMVVIIVLLMREREKKRIRQSGQWPRPL